MPTDMTPLDERELRVVYVPMPATLVSKTELSIQVGLSDVDNNGLISR